MITKQVELIRKKEFTIVALNLENETFIIHVASISLDSDVHLIQRAQIVLLKINKACISIFSKYANFVDIFSKNLAAKLPEYTRIYDYIINLIKGYQLLYEPKYGPGSMKL